jgi:hypothetical protein
MHFLNRKFAKFSNFIPNNFISAPFVHFNSS